MNNQNHMIRLLDADEIECRVGTIGKNGLSLLLYKDARVDQKILDECFSPCGMAAEPPGNWWKSVLYRGSLG